jgi:predicted ArsR family transcriptional regulator
MVADVTKRRPAQPSALGGDVAAVAALNDPLRLALYEYVTGQAGPVSRDQAAEALGVGRKIAAFHLDRLADQGLLDVAFRRLSGRQGPGAGRPAKLYSRSARQVQVSLPPRHYELAARLFAEALATPNPARTLTETARAFGESIGARERQQAGLRTGTHPPLENTVGILANHGYQPSIADGQITLRNCPFDALAHDYRDVVCTMNRALIDGLVTGLNAHDLTTAYQPQAGQCCVTINRQPADRSASGHADRPHHVE